MDESDVLCVCVGCEGRKLVSEEEEEKEEEEEGEEEEGEEK